MQSHRVKKYYSNGVVWTNNNLLFLDLHSGVKGCEEVGRLYVFVHGIIPELMHRLGTINTKQDHISFSFEELQNRGYSVERCVQDRAD